MATKFINRQLGFRRGKMMLLLICSVLILCYSCNDSHPPKKGVKFFAVKYDKATIKSWLDTADKTAGFVLQFYSTTGESADTAFGAISYQLDSAMAYHGPDTLQIERDSSAYVFAGRIILGNNWISRDDINSIFTKPDNTERDFDYVLLIPKLDQFNNAHIVYDLKVFKGTVEIPDIFLGRVETKPSPPAPPGG